MSIKHDYLGQRDKPWRFFVCLVGSLYNPLVRSNFSRVVFYRFNGLHRSPVNSIGKVHELENFD